MEEPESFSILTVSIESTLLRLSLIVAGPGTTGKKLLLVYGDAETC